VGLKGADRYANPGDVSTRAERSGAFEVVLSCGRLSLRDDTPGREREIEAADDPTHDEE
jgi:hypothetical protein